MRQSAHLANDLQISTCCYQVASEPAFTKATRRHTSRRMSYLQPTVCTRCSDMNQDMGLGKTLSTLALICHGIDRICDLPSSQACKRSRASLIVTPKSSRCSMPHFGRSSSTSTAYANMAKPYMGGSSKSRGIIFYLLHTVIMRLRPKI